MKTGDLIYYYSEHGTEAGKVTKVTAKTVWMDVGGGVVLRALKKSCELQDDFIRREGI